LDCCCTDFCAKRLPAADYARNKRGSSRQRYSYRSQLKTSAAVPNRRWCLCSATGIEKLRLMRWTDTGLSCMEKKTWTLLDWCEAVSVEKKKGAMLGGETVGEGELESGGRLLRVVVVERRRLILLVRVNYFGASCCFWRCHSAASSFWLPLLETLVLRVGDFAAVDMALSWAGVAVTCRLSCYERRSWRVEDENKACAMNVS